MNLLTQIVENKKREIEQLKAALDVPGDWKKLDSPPLPPGHVPDFYRRLSEAQTAGQPFFVTEFKRKSPSEGWINQDADLPAQIGQYIRSGAGAISVLTDAVFFGGSYADLKLARSILDRETDADLRPLLLQKDFILDPVQIFLAKQCGADLILLIAAILTPDRLLFLKNLAESIGLGVLVEVHDADELEQIQFIPFPVLGINNRDLKTFRTSLNRFNVLRMKARGRMVVAESGILDFRHFQMLRKADGFLIGTGLMREAQNGTASGLGEYFQVKGRFLFKACGIRTSKVLAGLSNKNAGTPDFIGINFSPLSKRKADVQTLEALSRVKDSKFVAVFYGNTQEDILETLQKYPFQTAQFYAGDVSPAFIRRLKVRVLLALRVVDDLPSEVLLETLVEPYAADIDCFILDAQAPGSGVQIQRPLVFPYPFLLAGGMKLENLHQILSYENCIGVDIASGIESDNTVDPDKIEAILERLAVLSLPDDL